MSTLFGDELFERPRREVAPGAHWVPGWLTLRQQSWITARFREWAAGPVPIRGAVVNGHEMSVKTVCLGWHWRPYAYSREAVDVNGNRVLDFPDWMVRLGRRALAEVGEGAGVAAGEIYHPDTALVNYYDHDARMGMHQDKDESSLAPVVSLSIGDTCRFRFGNTENRGRPYEDIDLASGDLFVFGGPSRLAYHGIPKIYPGTAPDGCGLERGRINITMRVTGLPG
ncbi:alpha-ketoglutarate-dependent dioxygenase AlkB family protein [Kineosporia succinea]|uniref:Alkylated DNA repair protein (DNA oxidative demethylase) n=1 Tax=Kineosporia succinea TaxID=84632 RepID=A0ABT9NW45_9ACTN|nr:alpha-ketoglutarate-dependent dioxygenase AlkB [Kineosporia succinea]MDP9824369.1 alkylated DNA repair protein (DNA oxidative demethylase) [Kineosporia succinea]